MKEFLDKIGDFFSFLVTQWWGILCIVIVCLAVWILLSAVLYRVFFKRFYDILLSGLALIILSPLIALLAVLVRVKLGSPIIFVQYRPGKHGKIFKMKKFRTMTSVTDENGQLLPDKLRMTKFGKFLRSTSLDELPELWNIFIGQMSIIGPRPQLVKDLVFMNDEINKRHNVRGGLTGLAQVSGRNNLTWEERFSYDLQYVEEITIWRDAKIFFRTIFKVFSRSDVATDGMETSEDYGDYLLRIDAVSKEEYDEKILTAYQYGKEVKNEKYLDK